MFKIKKFLIIFLIPFFTTPLESKEPAKLISEIMNSSIEIEADSERIRPETSEVNRLYGCNQKIISLTNWQPKYCGLNGFKKGLEITIEWFLDPNNLELYSSEYMI